MRRPDKSYGHAENSHQEHKASCDWDMPEGMALDFIPPDDMISYCPQCKGLVSYASCCLDMVNLKILNITHPCHHELTEAESKLMLEGVQE